MAEVRLGVQVGEGGFCRLVVIKRMRQALRARADLANTLADEGRMLARLADPTIVQVLDVCRDGDGPFLVVEYLRGETLLDVMRELARTGRGIPWPAVCRIGAEVAAGLAAAHEATADDGRPRPILHRDLTPSNVMLCWNGAVKLIDFGIAKAAGAGGTTRVGTVKGKLAYLAPELLGGAPADRRSDLFQLGVMLHEALSGRRLFDAPDDAGRVRAVLDRAIPPLSPDVNGLPVEVERVVEGLLERDPGRRLSSARRVQERLEEVLGRIGAQVTRGQLGAWLERALPERRAAARARERRWQRTLAATAAMPAVQPMAVLSAAVTTPVAAVTTPVAAVTTPVAAAVDGATLQMLTASAVTAPVEAARRTTTAPVGGGTLEGSATVRDVAPPAAAEPVDRSGTLVGAPGPPPVTPGPPPVTPGPPRPALARPRTDWSAGEAVPEPVADPPARVLRDRPRIDREPVDSGRGDRAPTPQRTARWRVMVAVVAVAGLVGGGVAAAWGPCQGPASSSRGAGSGPRARRARSGATAPEPVPTVAPLEAAAAGDADRAMDPRPAVSRAIPASLPPRLPGSRSAPRARARARARGRSAPSRHPRRVRATGTAAVDRPAAVPSAAGVARPVAGPAGIAPPDTSRVPRTDNLDPWR